MLQLSMVASLVTITSLQLEAIEESIKRNDEAKIKGRPFTCFRISNLFYKFNSGYATGTPSFRVENRFGILPLFLSINKNKNYEP